MMLLIQLMKNAGRPGKALRRLTAAGVPALALLGAGGHAGNLLASTAASSNAEPVFEEFDWKPDSESVNPGERTPRELFNLATRRLQAGKLEEAEALLQRALTSQDGRVQSPALYNLGHTRFAQGAEQLKRSLEAGAVAGRGRAAAQRADDASARAREALAGNDLQRMIAAYMNGRGARRELKSATQAVRRALDLHGGALRKWQRARDDFEGAAELNPADTNAVHNVKLVEREIARLVDSIREMQQAMQQMGQSQRGLQEQMKQLGGRIPEPMMPPGARGDDEDSEDGENGEKEPPEPKPGQQEKASRDGEEMSLSPEEAGWILEGFRLDSDRRLPMGGAEPGKPKTRNTRNW